MTSVSAVAFAPRIGTSNALSSTCDWVEFVVGRSPSISSASMASLVSVDIAGVSTVVDVGVLVVDSLDGFGCGCTGTGSSFFRVLYFSQVLVGVLAL